MYSKIRIIILVFVITSVYFVPRSIKYQGKLLDIDGVGINDELPITFRLYDSESGGVLLWQEIISDVEISRGLFSVELGASDNFDTLSFASQYWLEIVVDTEVLSPREKLHSVPYAIRAGSVDNLPSSSNDYIQNQDTTDQSASMRISGDTYVGGDMGIGTTEGEHRFDVEGIAIAGRFDSRFGSALDFNGSDDLVTIEHHSSLNITDQIAIGCWIKPEGVGEKEEIITYNEPEDLTDSWLDTDQYFDYDNLIDDSGELVLPPIEPFSVVSTAYWKLDEPSGSIAYDEQSFKDGSRSGNVTINHTGIMGTSYRFIPTTKGSDKVTFSGIGDQATQTWSFWVKLNNIPEGETRYILNGGSSNWNILRVGHSDSTFFLQFYTGGTPNHRIIHSDVTPQVGIWYHLVVVFGSTGMRMFVNGLQQSETESYTGRGASPGTTKSLGSLTIQAHSIDGYIDEVGFWDRALSDSEVSELFNSYDGYKGYRVSNPLSLNEINNVTYSNIKWTSTEPSGTSIKIATGINEDPSTEPDTYTEATNDALIPGISVSDDLTGKYLWIKQELSSNDSETTPSLSSLEVNIESVMSSAVVIGKGQDSYQIEMDSDFNITGYVNSNEISAPVTRGRWYHLMMTFDGTYQNLYIDGELERSQSITGSIPINSDALYIGSNFRGMIDDVRLYNTSLTQEVIQFNMFRELEGDESGLISYWKFNEGFGNVTSDYSSNENNGAISSAKWYLPKLGSDITIDNGQIRIPILNCSHLCTDSLGRILCCE